MIRICIDTNAILDLCYRYYPSEKFAWIWDGLKVCKSSGFISFYICASVEDEVLEQISRFDYDESVYESFLDLFRPEIIEPDEHGQITADFKIELLNCPIAESSPHVKQDNYADLDIVSLGKHYNSEGYVLTSEQKTPNINWNKPNAHKGIKVPNLADRFGVRCGSWINLIDELDISH